MVTFEINFVIEEEITYVFLIGALDEIIPLCYIM